MCYFEQWYHVFRIRFSLSQRAILRLLCTSKYDSFHDRNISCNRARFNDVMSIVCQCRTICRIRCDDGPDHAFTGQRTLIAAQRANMAIYIQEPVFTENVWPCEHITQRFQCFFISTTPPNSMGNMQKHWYLWCVKKSGKYIRFLIWSWSPTYSKFCR